MGIKIDKQTVFIGTFIAIFCFLVGYVARNGIATRPQTVVQVDTVRTTETRLKIDTLRNNYVYNNTRYIAKVDTFYLYEAGVCDSVRTYYHQFSDTVVQARDTLEVLGKLLSHRFGYTALRPTEIRTIKEVINNRIEVEKIKEVAKTRLYLTAGLKYPFSGEAGLQLAFKNWTVYYHYDPIRNQHTAGGGINLLGIFKNN